MAAAIVSIMNLKGGVGKSTIAMILSEYLTFHFHKRVLVIDMDSQANLTYAMISLDTVGTQRAKNRTVYNFYKQIIGGKLPKISDFIASPPLVVSNISRWTIHDTPANIEMIVSIPDMAELDEDLLLEPERPDPDSLRQSLRIALNTVRDRYDYIIIDCPPGLSLFSSAALIASDFFVAPIIPEPLSLQGIDLIQKRIVRLGKDYPTPQFAGCVMNKVVLHRLTHKTIAKGLYQGVYTGYYPFHFWIPDNEKMRKLGEFDVELLADQTSWGGGVEHKFGTLHEKYGLSYKLTNPADPVIGRQDTEGEKYKLVERLASLTEEFMERVSVEV